MVKILSKIVNDTLKKDGKWSRTSLTMHTAWLSCLIAFFYDLFTSGFNEYAFYGMLSVALGSKVTDAWSNKINGGNNPSTSQP